MSRMIGLCATTGVLVVALPTIVRPCMGCNGGDRCNSDVLTVGCKAAWAFGSGLRGLCVSRSSPANACVILQALA